MSIECFEDQLGDDLDKFHVIGLVTFSRPMGIAVVEDESLRQRIVQAVRECEPETNFFNAQQFSRVLNGELELDEGERVWVMVDDIKALESLVNPIGPLKQAIPQGASVLFLVPDQPNFNYHFGQFHQLTVG